MRTLATYVHHCESVCQLQALQINYFVCLLLCGSLYCLKEGLFRSSVACMVDSMPWVSHVSYPHRHTKGHVQYICMAYIVFVLDPTSIYMYVCMYVCTVLSLSVCMLNTSNL